MPASPRVQAKLKYLASVHDERQKIVGQLKEINARRDRAKASFVWQKRLYFPILVLAIVGCVVLPGPWWMFVILLLAALVWPVPLFFLEKASGRTPAQLLVKRVGLEFELIALAGVFAPEDVPRHPRAQMMMWQMQKDQIRSINKDLEGAIARFDDKDTLRNWQIHAQLCQEHASS